LRSTVSIIDDPKECEGRPVPSAESLVGKNAGPTGSVLMIDSNQVWECVQFRIAAYLGSH
jgi:L-fuconate dehydratase